MSRSQRVDADSSQRQVDGASHASEEGVEIVSVEEYRQVVAELEEKNRRLTAVERALKA